jgi:hypothetical protein
MGEVAMDRVSGVSSAVTGDAAAGPAPRVP